MATLLTLREKSIINWPKDGYTRTYLQKVIKSTSSSSGETEEERIVRVQKLLRNVMRMKLKIPCCKVYYVEGWGWL